MTEYPFEQNIEKVIVSDPIEGTFYEITGIDKNGNKVKKVIKIGIDPVEIPLIKDGFINVK